MRNIEVFTEGEVSLEADGVDENFFIGICETVFNHAKTDNVTVSIILTDNDEITRINNEFRGKNQPTDVISFAYRNEPFPAHEGIMEELGDVYISIDKAREQAIEYSTTPVNELKRLVIHGLLHLLGYDHEKSDEDEKIMNALEQELFLLV